ncbi:UNVERIFIED_CONTAM: hypothetical protein H355_006114 [Colinus virginianus]|nr:hypothetical protein H355_006114 [Colinus virginianus]
MKLDAEGTYECSVTGLIFEVTKAVTINYSLLSWSKYAGLVEPPWVVGGPLFDVRCELPSALTSIAFPHSLCLGGEYRHAVGTHGTTPQALTLPPRVPTDGGSPPAFKVLHIKGAGAAIEPSTDFSASHVRWLVSSLSPVGPLIRSEEPLLYHGAVVLYKAVDDDPSLLFRVYVATNNDSFIKDISRAVKHSKKKFIKIDKPPVCQKLLQNGKRYRLICEPEAEITPEEIEFVDGSLLKLKSYIEVYFEKPDDFTLSLVELDSDAVVWKAKLRENGAKTRCLLTDQQLMVIAKLFGVEWKEIAIECLQMEMKDIQQIQANEEEVNIQKFLMLSKWREREQSNGTAQALCNRLREKVSYEIVQALEEYLTMT